MACSARTARRSLRVASATAISILSLVALTLAIIDRASAMARSAESLMDETRSACSRDRLTMSDDAWTCRMAASRS